MGTNYYIHAKTGHYLDRMDPEAHIGKRSAAGPFCWTCRQTLCKAGETGIHLGESEWYDACPKCHARLVEESLRESSAGRELGFNKSPPKVKTGVRSCSSFTWAMKPTIVSELPRRGKPVVDEYGRRFSVKAFLAVLEECPVQYLDAIGTWFS